MGIAASGLSGQPDEKTKQLRETIRNSFLGDFFANEADLNAFLGFCCVKTIEGQRVGSTGYNASQSSSRSVIDMVGAC
jgi:hypothetical protein